MSDLLKKNKKYMYIYLVLFIYIMNINFLLSYLISINNYYYDLSVYILLIYSYCSDIIFLFFN